MTLVELPLWASVIAASFFSSLAAVALVGHPRLLGRVRRLAQPERHDNDEGTVLLFDGEFVVDATPKAMDLLSVTKHADVSWGLVSSFFEQRFPGFVEKIKALSEDDSDSASASLESGDGSATFTASLRSGTLRIEYFDQYSETPARSVEQRTLDAMERELDLLRATTEHCPFLVWCQSHDGEITWANRAYLEAAEPPGNDAAHAAWPPPMAFDFQLIQSLAERGGRTRIAKKGKDSEDQWYDCHAASFEEYTLFTAIDVNATVAAERQLRDFMQTLTKTFAHLTVGLAIFDKERRLALFNPALKELTALQIDFLTTRPTLLSFLDRLRDKRMLPEPKDYGSWRQEIAALEAAAAVGTYMQTWTLPNGRTYRVTGRPHADGAIAFLFEDISAEISLTRRFRSELELGQAVVDAMDDAIAVFTPTGLLSMTNSAYTRLWDTEDTEALHDVYVADATASWKAHCAPTTVWREFCAYVLGGSDRKEWSASVRLLNGNEVTFDCRPMPGGATLVRFAQEARSQGNLMPIGA